MAHSTLTVSDFQYRQAFRSLIPARLCREAIQATTRRSMRQRLLPPWLLLPLLIVWFFRPEARLSFIARWFHSSSRSLPSDPSLYRARARLGWRPLRWLRHRLVRFLAEPQQDCDAFYQGHRLLAIDGTILTVADTQANDRCFGRSRNQHRHSGYPLARVVALAELATHALIRWVTRTYRRSEQNLAMRLLPHVPPGALLLADRGFHCYDWWHLANQRHFELLLRVKKGPKFLAETRCSDGSVLSWVSPRRGKNKKQRQIRVRVIAYEWTDEKGKVHTSRLLTSLLDCQLHPARTLVNLYHRRWEQEGIFREIKSQLTSRTTQIRAEEPLRVLQEIEGLLMGHYVLRWVMLQAAREKGIPAVEVSFRGAVRIVQLRLRSMPKKPQARKKWWQEVLKAMGNERVEKRRGRRCPRVRKVTRSHWPVKKPSDQEQPPVSFQITPHPLC